MNRRLPTCVAALLLASCASTHAPFAQHPLFGVAASDTTSACAAFPHAKQLSLQSVAVILPSSQRVIVSALTAELPTPCSAIATKDLPGPYFALRIHEQFARGELGIVVLTPPWEVSARGIRAQATRDRELSVVQFRSCASMEGIHLTAWSGEPLRSTRVWHEYVHLGYDLEPSCSPKDYQ